MQKEKILIVEDEEKISGIIKSYLEREGFQVTVVPTGNQRSVGYVKVLIFLSSTSCSLILTEK